MGVHLLLVLPRDSKNGGIVLFKHYSTPLLFCDDDSAAWRYFIILFYFHFVILYYLIILYLLCGVFSGIHVYFAAIISSCASMPRLICNLKCMSRAGAAAVSRRVLLLRRQLPGPYGDCVRARESLRHSDA
jgi:hypothetical protein